MDEVSKKYEAFITDTIKTLYILDAMKEDQAKIEKELTAYQNETDINFSEVQACVENLGYNRAKIRDIYSSIRTYFRKITYEKEDLKLLESSTLYNAHIVKTTLPKTITKQEYIPDFKVDIVNLGFEGILPEDDLVVSIYNTDAGISLTQSVKVGQTFSKLGERKQVNVSRIKCPKDSYEYTINIKLAHDSIYYGELTLYAINIK